MADNFYEVIIIGGGPAGLTAGLYTARAGLSTLILEGASLGGNAAISGLIDNYPGFPDGVEGTDLIELFRQQAERFGAELRYEQALSMAAEEAEKTLHTNVQDYRCRAIIIAAGAKRKRLEIDGETEYLGRGVSYCATCDGPFFTGKRVAVVGGGDAAFREALHLTALVEKVYLIHRRAQFTTNLTAYKQLATRPNAEILTNQIITRLTGDTLLSALELKNTLNGQTTDLAVSGLFVSIGLIAGEPLPGYPEVDAGGYVVSSNQVETSLPGVFVAGDIRNKPFRQVATAVGDGTMAAMAVSDYLLQDR
jgi:thioredoxin reductase (NADPH)